jgi:hypothetical protein
MPLDREAVTDALDVIGLGLIAAGTAGGLWPWLAWWALVVAGVVVLTGSATSSQATRARARRRGRGVS